MAACIQQGLHMLVLLHFVLRPASQDGQCTAEAISNPSNSASVLMQDLVVVVPAYVGRFIADLVKVMRRIAEDHSQNKGLLLGPTRPPARKPKSAPTPLPCRRCNIEYHGIIAVVDLVALLPSYLCHNSIMTQVHRMYCAPPPTRPALALQGPSSRALVWQPGVGHVALPAPHIPQGP